MPNYHEKNYSEETAKKIDEEVRKIIDEAHERALEIVQENRDKVELMTECSWSLKRSTATMSKMIMNGEWDIEKKRTRLKFNEDAHRKLPPPPPAPVVNPGTDVQPQQI